MEPKHWTLVHSYLYIEDRLAFQLMAFYFLNYWYFNFSIECKYGLRTASEEEEEECW